MTSSHPTARELDRLCELAALGGALAGSALGDVLSQPVRSGAPRVCELSSAMPPERWCTGILFEVEGDLTGLLAIVMSEARRTAAVECMLGSDGAAAQLAESALRELGNILASHTVSAIADATGATLLPTIPTLAMQAAGDALAAWIAERVEIDLVVGDSDDSALLVFVPERPKSPAL
jgi:chemotaxis protein CheC